MEIERFKVIETILSKNDKFLARYPLVVRESLLVNRESRTWLNNFEVEVMVLVEPS